MDKNSNALKDSKVTWKSSLLKKIKKFGEDGIMKLPEKMAEYMEQNGEYVVQYSS